MSSITSRRFSLNPRMALSAPPSTMILGPATARVHAERPRGRMRDEDDDDEDDDDDDFAAAFPRTVAADGSDDAEDATTCIMMMIRSGAE